jgi:hypothetical protein
MSATTQECREGRATPAAFLEGGATSSGLRNLVCAAPKECHTCCSCRVFEGRRGFQWAPPVCEVLQECRECYPALLPRLSRAAHLEVDFTSLSAKIRVLRSPKAVPPSKIVAGVALFASPWGLRKCSCEAQAKLLSPLKTRREWRSRLLSRSPHLKPRRSRRKWQEWRSSPLLADQRRCNCGTRWKHHLPNTWKEWRPRHS